MISSMPQKKKKSQKEFTYSKHIGFTDVSQSTDSQREMDIMFYAS